MTRLLLALGLTVLLAAPGCGARFAQQDPSPIVRKVKVQTEPVLKKGRKKAKPGRTSLPQNDIKNVLAQRATSFWAIPPSPFALWLPTYHLNGDDWQRDRIRISNYYAERGWFDARVTGTQVAPLGKELRKDGSPRFVQILHTVREGDRSAFRRLSVRVEDEGLNVDGDRLRAALAEHLPELAGKPFRLETVQEVAGDLRTFLQDRSHARARVEHVVDAYPEQGQVDVALFVQPGPTAVFGRVEVVFEGEQRVRERDVRKRVAIEPGARFNAKDIRTTQRRIYEMGVFALATVTPEVDAATETTEQGELIVPVTILLRERKPRTTSFGFGFGWQIGSFDTHGSGSIAHINLFERLLQAKISGTAGFALRSADDFGPIGTVGLELLWPDFPLRTLSLHGGAEIQHEIEDGYRVGSAEGDVGLTWAPLKPLKLNVSYNIGYFDILPRLTADGLDEAALAAATAAGLTDDYLLYFFRQSLVLDLRDQALAANKGGLLSVLVDEGGFGQGFSFVRIDADLRGYLPLGTPRIVLAGRLRGAGIVHLDDQEVPTAERLYVGGDGSVRGWQTDRLSPWIGEPDCTPSLFDDCAIAIGGDVAIAASVELRGNPWGGLWLAGFADFGRAFATAAEVDAAKLFSAEGLQPGFGGGIRYDTPVGRFRLDVAAHPPALTAAEFGEATVWNIHFGIGESF